MQLKKTSETALIKLDHKKEKKICQKALFSW